MGDPQFKIFGTERRLKKKELSELKSFIKNFWYYHQLDKDMASIYGGTDTYPMSDERAKQIFDSGIDKIRELEYSLSIPYTK